MRIPRVSREVNRDVEEMGAKVLHQWAALGAYDFVNIVEAPDDMTIAKVSIALGARGKREARVAAPDPGRRLPLQSRIARTSRPQRANIELIAPAAFISLAIPLVVFFAFQRYFAQGLLAWSVK